MTHAEATEHLKAGRSVSVKVNGVRTHVSSLEKLPSESQMAKGNPEKEKAARESLLAQRERIERELAEIEEKSGTPKKQTAAEKKELAALQAKSDANEELTDEEKARLEALKA